MIPLLCAGVLFMVLWRQRRLIFVVLPGLLFSFPQLISGIIHLFFPVILFVFGLAFDIFKLLLHIFIHVVPFAFNISRPFVIGFGQMSYHSVTQASSSVLSVLNAFRHKLQSLLIAIGTIAAFMSLLVNFVGDVINSGAAAHRRNQQRRRNGQQQNRNHPDRLYPDLSDEYENTINDNYAHENMRNRNREDQIHNADFRDGTRHSEGLEPTAPEAGLEPTAPVMDDNACVVCFERDRNAAVFPCGHTHMCLQCTRSIIRLNNNCPICQQPIQEYRQVFV